VATSPRAVRSGDAGPSRDPVGRLASTPGDVPAAGWRDVLLRTREEVKADNVVLLGAGVAFFALLALVPGLIALVSVYGLVADPSDVDRQVSDLLAAAPTEVRDLVSEQLRSVTESSDRGLGLTAIIGVALALWSASSGMNHLISAVNAAYDEEEGRGFVARRGLALLLTIGAIAFAAVALVAITALPALVEETAAGDAVRVAVSILRWPLLAVGLVVALSILYRYAPDRDRARWSWVAPGTIVATVVWVLASIGFSIYTSRFGSYGETYGSLGAVVVLMLWLLLSAVAIILGAEINAEAERQTRRDSTDPPRRPRGQRGAYAADTVGESAREQT
jgi:membrane protein